MKREEQIRSAAFEASTRNDDYKKYTKDGIARMFFVEGAMFADSNQPSPWISVEDELPNINSNSYSDIVLTIDENQNIVVAFYSLYRLGWMRADVKDDIDGSIIQNDITHWMPIPELPKEE